MDIQFIIASEMTSAYLTRELVHRQQSAAQHSQDNGHGSGH